MNNRKNFITALVLQISTMISGLILPRLIITTFGSEINGLSSSITQFLSFISLLEGGLGAVVLAELYKPIQDSNTNRAKEILYVCQNFFFKLALVYVVYTLVLGVVFPRYICKDYGFIFTFLLVCILSFTHLFQYLFSITNKLLLQACQKVYIANAVSTLTVILNLVLSILIIKIYPELHVVKLGSAIVFLLQPIIYRRFIDSRYSIHGVYHKATDKSVLKNRWSGFTQNLAYFINMNTDIVVLTVFASLIDVSVYSIYMLAIAAIRAIIVSVTNSYQAALGKYYAEGNMEKLKEKFSKFEHSFWVISIVLFSTCLLLINPFIQLYTKGVGDANYFQPSFALIIVIANMIYCIREPYRLLILAAGKFKQTNFGSIAEALINLIISIALVWKYGLIGVAIGTLIAVTYRLLYFVWFLKNDIVYYSFRNYIGLFFTFFISVIVNVCFYFKYPILIDSSFGFVLFGCSFLAIEMIGTLAIYNVSMWIQKLILYN